MTIINTGENQIKWTVRKGLSSVNEDFTRSDVMLFAISQTNKIPLPITSKEKGVIVATIPHVVPATQENPEYGHIGIQEDTYDVELVWIKNKRELNRTYLHNAFRVSGDPLIPTLTVAIVSTAQSYGYDGLSAYEIAMFRRLSEGERVICENQWLEDLLAEKANTTDLNALRYRVDDIEEVLPELEEDISDLEDRVSNLNDSKADKDDVYTKQYVDDNFATKTSVYTKSEVDSALGLKANKTALESAKCRISDAETDIEILLHSMNLAETAIGNIEDIMPSLATKESVNSSIATNTATFRGTYNLVTHLHLAIDAPQDTIANNIPNVVSSADNNDYVFVLIPISDEDPTSIAKVERYKFNGSVWAFEYTLNNSGFTAEQWASLNSGITDTHVQKVNGLDAALAAKLDVLTFDSVPTENSSNPVTSNGLYIELSKKLSVDRDAVIDGNLTVNGGIKIQTNDPYALNYIYTTNNRLLCRFDQALNGYVMGNNGVGVAIETGDTNNPTPVYHRITRNGTAVDYPILDTYNLPANVKTINNTSVAGAGNIDINDAFKVVYGVTPIEDIVDAYKDGKYIYAVISDQDENSDTGSIYVLYSAYIDINTTNTQFGFSQYYGDSNDISWFELTNDGYSEIYYSTIVTTGDLTAALSDYTTTSDLTTLLNNKQNTVDSNHKLSADVIDDSSATNKFVTSSDKTLWNTVTEKAPLPFVVNVGINPSDVISVDKTLSELETAHNAGKIIRVQFSSASGISFEEDATRINESLVITYVTHAVSGGKHYIVTIYEENNVTKASYQEVLDSDKQDVISDLSTIRSGAASGATAYQKPQSGIPANDIASGVIPDISNLANKSGSLSQDFAAKSLSVLGRGTSNGIKLYRSDGQIPYGRIIMESDLVSNGIDYMLPTTGVAEQSAVVLATKASVDAKYTKPSSGIPASDIAAGVIPDVSNFITNSVLTTALATKQDKLVSGTNIKTINNTSVLGSGNLTLENSSNKTNDIANNDTDTTKYPSCKAVADYVSAIVGNINSILETI